MKKVQFSVQINAPVNKVFRTMLGLDNISTYEAWTKEFNPTSTLKGTWKKGSKIYFIGTNEDGSQGGMVSEIVEHITNKFISIKHIGILKGDEEILEGQEVEQWAGGLENYSFEEKDGITTVVVETDTLEDYEAYFNTTYPKALNKLKEVAETR